MNNAVQLVGRGKGAENGIGGSRMEKLQAAYDTLPEELASLIALPSFASWHAVRLLKSKCKRYGAPSIVEMHRFSEAFHSMLMTSQLCRPNLRRSSLNDALTVQFDTKVSLDCVEKERHLFLLKIILFYYYLQIATSTFSYFLTFFIFQLFLMKTEPRIFASTAVDT